MLSQFKKIFHSLSDKLGKIFRFVRFLIWPKNKWVGRLMPFGFVAGLLPLTVHAGLSEFLLFLLNFLLFKIAQLLGWIVMQIFGVVLIVSSYNNFVTHPAVIKGWVLMRDMCNLFFVMILLVIAFMVILQVKKYEPTKMLYRVVLAAILVNFSKLICGIVIDFAQVVMMTFVNGYAASAGGNLVNALNLDSLLSLSTDENMDTEAAFQITVAMIAAIVVLVATIVVVFFILILLTLRITQLWILVVLSPFAFTLEAVPVGGFQQQASKWFTQFGWTVAVGPFMAFFLWLSLLVMSDPGAIVGDLSTARKVQSVNKANFTDTGGHATATTMEGLTQAAIGLSMLFGSLMIAQEAGGMIGDMASKGVASTKSATKWAANKMTGGVAEKGGAAVKGYQAKRNEFKQLKLAKYGRAGEKVMGLQAQAGRVPGFLLKNVASGIGAVGKAIDKKRDAARTPEERAERAKKKEDKAKNKKKKRDNRAKQIDKYKNSAFGKTMTKNWQSTNPMAEMFAKRIKTAHQNTKNGEAKEYLAGKTLDELKEIAKNTSMPSTIRNMGALELSRKGYEDDGDDVAPNERMSAIEYARNARNDLVRSGDKESLKAFDDNLEKGQANILFHISTDAEKTAMAKRMQKGDLEMKSQGPEAFGDVEFMDFYRKTVGNKKFTSTIKDASGRGEAYSDAVKGSMPNMAERVHVDLAERGSAEGIQREFDSRKAKLDKQIQDAEILGKPDDVARLKTEKNKLDLNGVGAEIRKQIEKDRDGFQNTQASITGSLEDAFGDRDNTTGKLDGNMSSKALEKMAKYIKKSAGKNLANLGIDKSAEKAESEDPDSDKKPSTSTIDTLADNVSENQLVQMLRSGEDGAGDKVNILVSRMLTRADDPENSNLKARLQTMLQKNNEIVGSLDDDVRRRATENFPPAEPKADKKDDKDNKDQQGQQASSGDNAQSGSGQDKPQSKSKPKPQAQSQADSSSYTYKIGEPVEIKGDDGTVQKCEYAGQANTQGHVRIKQQNGDVIERKLDTVLFTNKVIAENMRKDRDAFMKNRSGGYDTQA